MWTQWGIDGGHMGEQSWGPKRISAGAQMVSVWGPQRDPVGVPAGSHWRAKGVLMCIPTWFQDVRAKNARQPQSERSGDFGGGPTRVPTRTPQEFRWGPNGIRMGAPRDWRRASWSLVGNPKGIPMGAPMEPRCAPQGNSSARRMGFTWEPEPQWNSNGSPEWFPIGTQWGFQRGFPYHG